MSEPPIRRRREREVYANDYVRIYDDDVTFGAGTEGRYLRVEPQGDGPGAVVLPVRGGQVALVRSYRYPVGAWQWALPRGFAHGPDPLRTAETELFEETGIRGARLRVLGHVTPDSGIQAHRVAVVLAEVGDGAGVGPQDAEIAELRWVRLDELRREIADGRIEDAFTLAAICLAGAAGALPD